MNRILLMIPFISSSEGASVRELCRRFNISRSELTCDLGTLWLCGLPDYGPGCLIDYYIEGDRVFISMADYFSRPLNMTREEALALIVAGRALIRARIFRKSGPLGSALDKVESVLSEVEKTEVEELARRVQIEMDSYSGRWREIIDEGLKKGRILRVEYYSFSTDEVKEREVEPLSLIWSQGHWYLLGWCRLADDTRLFRLDRMKSVKLTGHGVKVRRDIEVYVPELIGEYKPGRKAHSVRLRFSGREGRRLIEEWPNAKLTERKDGSLLVELRTRNLSWLSNYLLRFGDRVRIDSPKELKRMVEEKAEALLGVYS